jgi:hypothetical protein
MDTHRLQLGDPLACGRKLRMEFGVVADALDVVGRHVLAMQLRSELVAASSIHRPEAPGLTSTLPSPAFLVAP